MSKEQIHKYLSMYLKHKGTVECGAPEECGVKGEAYGVDLQAEEALVLVDEEAFYLVLTANIKAFADDYWYNSEHYISFFFYPDDDHKNRLILDGAVRVLRELTNTLREGR